MIQIYMPISIMTLMIMTIKIKNTFYSSTQHNDNQYDDKYAKTHLLHLICYTECPYIEFHYAECH
jgi:hypothetical protein